MAKELLAHFGSMGALLAADKERLSEIKFINDSFIVSLRVMHEFLARTLKETTTSSNVISSWAALLDYLQIKMANLNLEQFRTLFLNKQNSLIADEVMATGTVDQTPVYPREIVKKALYHGASAIILVHNHPSGNSKPSKNDLELTTKIVSACKTVGVMVHDHVIVGRNEYYSFKSNMLL
jgi:DNA repair protein RadC